MGRIACENITINVPDVSTVRDEGKSILRVIGWGGPKIVSIFRAAKQWGGRGRGRGAPPVHPPTHTARCAEQFRNQ